MTYNKGNFQIGDVIHGMAYLNKKIIPNTGKDKSMIGTAIPYQYNLYSNLIINNSSVSTSEFQKMAYSLPVISSGLATLVNLIRNEIDHYQHENEKKADFINDMIDKMDTPFDQILSDILTALWAGFYVGEKKYVSDGRYVYIRDIAPRPPQSILFTVDSQGILEDEGIIQYYYNNLWSGYANILSFNQFTFDGKSFPNPYAALGDLDYPLRTTWAQPIGTVILPKSKCIHYVYKGLDGFGSPYGRSLLRPLYSPYVISTNLDGILLNAANNKASPLPVLVVDPNQTNTTQGDTAMQSIAASISGARTSGGENPFILLQGTKDSIQFHQLDSTANLSDLLDAKQYYDKIMSTGLLSPSELAGLSDKGSYALGKTQQDLMGRHINAIANSVKECLIDQLVKPTLIVNFGEDDEGYGSFEGIDDVAEDIALNLDKLNTLRLEGIKLTDEAIMSLMDLNLDSIDLVATKELRSQQEEMLQQQKQFNPPATNEGVNSNYRRARHGGM